MNRGPLAGRRIVVTRPAGQADALAALIRAAGGEPVCFPALEILEVADPRPVFALIDRMETFDLAIFISPSAVRQGLAMARRRRDGKPWPARLAVAAIGGGSRRALEDEGFSAVIAPASGADSESLLAHPALASVAGRRIVIFRGEGGRELLGETLERRGARVEYAECYRRGRPDADPAPLAGALTRGEVDAVTVSSSEGLANLVAMLGRGWLRNTPLFVPHARVAQDAERLGAGTALVAGALDAEMLARLVAYFANSR